MKIIDTHCDALYKMQKSIHETGQRLNFLDDETLDTNLTRLKKGNVKVQFFAVFLPPEIPSDLKWHYALEQIDIFYTDIVDKFSEVKPITSWKDFDSLKENEIGVILTLEGADCFGNDLMKLRHLYRLGIMSVGLTWNNANLCADGIGEDRQARLSNFGREVVLLNNEYKVLTDVSHLTEKGFYDVIELADYPFASHSNAKYLCNHLRNLTDEQIQTMFQHNGMIHVVFNPPFIDEAPVEIEHLVKHINHLVKLGGKNHIGFGSDFDGIDSYINHLEDASMYPNLINQLLEHYSEKDVQGFAFNNFINNRPQKR